MPETAALAYASNSACDQIAVTPHLTAVALTLVALFVTHAQRPQQVLPLLNRWKNFVSVQRLTEQAARYGRNRSSPLRPDGIDTQEELCASNNW